MKGLFCLSLITAIALQVNAQTSSDEQAIRANISTMQEGWNTKSGEKYASVFDEVHDFIVWNGYYFPNSTQQMTMRTHQGLFDGVYKNYDIALKVDKIKFLKPDIALTHVIGAGYTKGEAIPENPTVLMSIIMQKKGDSWKIISFHNLDLLLFDNKETMAHSPMPPQVMYASWYKKQ